MASVSVKDALAFRASEIMMRVNATITALLALAILYLFSVDSLAQSPHHSVHKTVSTHRKGVATKKVRTQTLASPTRHTTSSPIAPVALSTKSVRKHNNELVRSAAHKHSPASKPAPAVFLGEGTSRPRLPDVDEAASTPVILPEIYNKRGRLIVPPPLKGSHEILVRQNQVADRDGLDRIQNDEDLLQMRSRHLLVSLPVSNALQVDERLPVNRRYCRPWTAQFLATLARAHYAHFHTPLQINSAVRTVEFQQHLIHINGNAAPAEGGTASPHLTGQAIDIAKHGLSLTEIAWLRAYLLPLVQEGKVDVEEEFQQACFHISVYKQYLPSAADPGRDGTIQRHNATTALAAAMR